MKILMANATHRWGGVKSWTLAVGRGLITRGHEISIVLRPDDPFGDAAAEAGFDVGRLSYGPDWNPLSIAYFAARLGRGGPDLLVTNVGKDNRTAAVAARLRGVPVIHRVGGPGDLRERAVIRWTHRHLVSAILVPSRSTRDALLAHRWIEPEQVTVIPNGIDLDRFRPGIGAGVLRSELAAGSEGDFLVGATGQLTRVKGHCHAVEAVARLVRRGVPARLTLIGAGPEMAGLKAQAQSLGISDRVHFTGFRRDVAELIEDFDIAVQPSVEEGLPHSVIEFMAKGKPVVASRLDGIAEAIEDNVSGLLVDAGKPEALEDAILKLWSDPERRREMGRAARFRAETEFGVETLISRTESYFLSRIRGARDA